MVTIPLAYTENSVSRLVTARIRTVMEGNVFSLSTTGWGGGGAPVRFPVPSPDSDPRSFPQGIPQSLVPCPFWGVPQDGGIPQPGLGSPPSQDGYPLARTGVPSSLVPCPFWEGGTPRQGYPLARTGSHHHPQPGLGYPLARTGVPPSPVPCPF